MEIRKIDVLSDPNAVLKIAKVYKETFGFEPWNEGFVCPVCSKTYPLSVQSSFCPSCLRSRKEWLVRLVEFWPESKVIADFYQENIKGNALCLVIEEKKQIVGFVWGYGMDISPKTATKIEAPELANTYRREVFYLDECGVLPEFQGRGYGKAMVQRILAEQPYDILILRTLENSVMRRLIENLGGEKILSIFEGRIIMKLIKTTSLHKFVVPDHY